MSTGQRFVFGVLAIVLAVGLFAAISLAIDKAQSAFTSRGTHARIQARMDSAKRERDAAAPSSQTGSKERP